MVYNRESANTIMELARVIINIDQMLASCKYDDHSVWQFHTINEFRDRIDKLIRIVRVYEREVEATYHYLEDEYKKEEERDV